MINDYCGECRFGLSPVRKLKRYWCNHPSRIKPYSKYLKINNKGDCKYKEVVEGD